MATTAVMTIKEFQGFLRGAAEHMAEEDGLQVDVTPNGGKTLTIVVTDPETGDARGTFIVQISKVG